MLTLCCVVKGRDIFKKSYRGPRVILDFVDAEPSLVATNSHIADVTVFTNVEKLFASMSEKAKLARAGSTILTASSPNCFELHQESIDRTEQLKQFVCPKVRWMELVVKPL